MRRNWKIIVNIKILEKDWKQEHKRIFTWKKKKKEKKKRRVEENPIFFW